MSVQRFIFRAYPSEDHPRYYPWQAATIAIFIGDNNNERALRAALNELAGRNWTPERVVLRDTLKKDRVRQEGGAVWQAFTQAEGGETFWLENLESLPMTTKENGQHLAAPRLSEEFMDRVVSEAGGRQLQTIFSATSSSS